MKPLRIYVDTSVIGGCLDEEFRHASVRLLEMARRGEAVLLLSGVLMVELDGALDDVRALLDTLPEEATDYLFASEESEALQSAYLEAKVVGPSSRVDAHHVALATVARADMIVSWNFRHIVHFDKIRMFNGVNLLRGYRAIEIYSPWAVVT